MSLVILVPVLRRPHRVVPLLESIGKVTPEPYRVLFITSPGDEAEHQALKKQNADWVCMDRNYEGKGDYSRKINYGYQVSDEEYIFLGADDLEFHPNWFENALAKLKLSSKYGVVGTNDLGNQMVIMGKHSTHSLVTRKYADKFGTVDEQGKILHEGYHHNYCDSELIGTAKWRGAWVFSRDSIVKHLHPDWGLAKRDEVYDIGKKFIREDAKLFQGRRHKWRNQ